MVYQIVPHFLNDFQFFPYVITYKLCTLLHGYIYLDVSKVESVLLIIDLYHDFIRSWARFNTFLVIPFVFSCFFFLTVGSDFFKLTNSNRTSGYNALHISLNRNN